MFSIESWRLLKRDREKRLVLIGISIVPLSKQEGLLVVQVKVFRFESWAIYWNATFAISESNVAGHHISSRLDKVYWAAFVVKRYPLLIAETRASIAQLGKVCHCFWGSFTKEADSDSSCWLVIDFDVKKCFLGYFGKRISCYRVKKSYHVCADQSSCFHLK